MRPPTETAIQKAISILIQSVEEENAVTERESGNPKTQVFRAAQVIETVSEAFRRAVDAECSKRRRCLNTFAAIHTLPLEIFIKILVEDITRHTLELPSSRSIPRSLTLRQHTLAQVCSFWRDTVLSEAGCWTQVRYGGPHTELILRKSKSALLHVTGSSRTPNAAEYLAFLHLVGQQAHRWRSASLTGPDEACQQAIVLSLRNSPYLPLADLTLDFKPGSMFPLPGFDPNFHGIRVLDIPPIPTLRRINFSYITPPWDSWRVGNLRTLELEGVRDGPTVADLHAILLTTPELENLTLKNVSCRQDEEGARSPVGSVALPHLSTLVLVRVQPEILDYAICNLRPADLRVLHLYQLHVKHIHATSTPCVAPTLNAYSELTLVNDCLEDFVLVDAGAPDDLGHDDATLQLCWEGRRETMEPLAKWLASCVCPGTQVNIEVNGRWDKLRLGDHETRYFPTSVLETLSTHIRSIDVKHHGDAVDILQCLSHPRFDDNGRRYWLCPNLTHLSLEQVRGLTEEDIDTFLENRWEDERGADAEGRPVPLEEFVSPNYTDFEDTDEDEY